MLTLHTNYTDNSHLLIGDTLKTKHDTFRAGVLSAANWATWCPRCKLGAGWLIKKDMLNVLKQELSNAKIKYKVIEAQIKVPQGTKTKTAEKLHPSYEIMISKAIKEIKDRKGASRQAIKKYIQANWRVSSGYDTVFRTQINRLADEGKLLRINSQRFRLSDELKKKYKL